MARLCNAWGGLGKEIQPSGWNTQWFPNTQYLLANTHTSNSSICGPTKKEKKNYTSKQELSFECHFPNTSTSTPTSIQNPWFPCLLHTLSWWLTVGQVEGCSLDSPSSQLQQWSNCCNSHTSKGQKVLRNVPRMLQKATTNNKLIIKICHNQ